MTEMTGPQGAGPAARAHVWIYRVAQNPRWGMAAAGLVFFSVLTALSLHEVDLRWFVPGFALFVPAPEVEDLLLTAVFLGQLALIPVSTGLTHLTTPPRIEGPEKRIPPDSLWRAHIPLFVVFIAGGTTIIRWFHGYRHEGFWSLLSAYVMYAGGWFLLALVATSLIVAGHRRILVFTPQALEYTRGRFRATIPWDAVTALRPVCDANVKNGGPGKPEHSSHFNLRAGVQLFVRDGVETHRRTMLFRIHGQDVMGVDCSGYKIEPNTLINAIYLLVENPELRPLLDTPEGAELFIGPDWNTRRRMRVGDHWDRRTGAIIRDGEAITP